MSPTMTLTRIDPKACSIIIRLCDLFQALYPYFSNVLNDTYDKFSQLLENLAQNCIELMNSHLQKLVTMLKVY